MVRAEDQTAQAMVAPVRRAWFLAAVAVVVERLATALVPVLAARAGLV